MACGAQHKSNEAGGKTWHKYTPLNRELYQRVEPIKRVGSGLIKYTSNLEGRQNGFNLEAKYPCRQNYCPRRTFSSDIFAILTPRRRI
jgi:hypothetical protein